MLPATRIKNIAKTLLVLSAALFFWSRLFFYGQDGIYGRTVVVWGDWAVHTTIASIFAYRPPDLWFVQHPLYIQGKFSYPFVADAISGILMRFNVDLVTAMVVPSFITTVLLLYVLNKLYLKLFSEKGSFLTFLSIFIFSGGLGFFINLANPNLSAVRNPAESQGSFTRDLSNSPVTPTLFGNIVYFQFIPQRAILLGFLVTIIILYFLYIYIQEAGRVDGKTYKKLFVLGLVSGLLTVIHPHSFIVLFICCVVLLVLRFRLFKALLIYALGAFIMFSILAYIFQDFSTASSFIKFHPGWLYRQDTKYPMNFFVFWLFNWGLFFPLSVISTIKYKLYKNFLVTGGWVIFILANTFLFQPWDWDNTKLFSYSYLFLSFPVSLYLAGLLRGTQIKQILGVTLLVACIISGFFDLVSIFNPKNNGYRMWSSDDLQVADNFRDNSSPRSIILTPNAHDNPIAALSGRRLVMGFRATLWSYGINYYKVENDIDSLYRGEDPDTGIIKKYKIDYIVESADNKYLQNCPVFMQSESYKIYRVDQCSRENI